MEPHKKGDATEAVVLAELKRRDIPVSIPFGDNQRYDFPVETPEGDFLRTQVQTGWTHDGVVEFRGYSKHTSGAGNVQKSYEGDVDCFLVFSHDHDRLFLVREAEVGANMSLRTEIPKQEQPSINWADDYAFDERWPP
jgi:hypothetical protein